MLEETKKIKNLLVESGFNYNEISVRTFRDNKGGKKEPVVEIREYRIKENLGLRLWEGEEDVVQYVRRRIKPLISEGYQVLELKGGYYVVLERYAYDPKLKKEAGYEMREIGGGERQFSVYESVCLDY